MTTVAAPGRTMSRLTCESVQGRLRVTTPRHVLVIDGPSDTATVLRAVLEPRGAVVERTRTHGLVEAWGSREEPDVVVVDMDGDDAEHTAVWPSAPHVVIGSARVTVDDSQTRFLQKPYQYPELIRAIEDLLTPRDAA